MNADKWMDWCGRIMIIVVGIGLLLSSSAADELPKNHFSYEPVFQYYNQVRKIIFFPIVVNVSIIIINNNKNNAYVYDK